MTPTSVVKMLGEQPAGLGDRNWARRQSGGEGAELGPLSPQAPTPIRLLGGDCRPAATALLLSGLWLGSTNGVHWGGGEGRRRVSGVCSLALTLHRRPVVP